VQRLDAIFIEPTADEYIRAITELKKLTPESTAGDPEQFRPSYITAVKNEIKPLQPQINRVVSAAENVLKSAYASTSNENVRKDMSELQIEMQKLIEGLQTGLDNVSKSEQKAVIDSINTAYDVTISSGAWNKLATITGLPVNSPEEKQAAKSSLKQKVNIVRLDFPQAIRTLLAPILDVQSGTSDLLMLPLSDPNVPIVVGSDDTKWRKWVNDVYSTNFFGNSEVAFRMEGLGENHIKGVLFDPSQVTKVGLNVFSVALRTTAAAYGLPLPSVTQSDTTQSTQSVNNLSKPLIDAEIGRIRSNRNVRGQRMETLFWKVSNADVTNKGTPPQANTESYNKLADLIECMADEIENPQTIKCGGSSNE